MTQVSRKHLRTLGNIEAWSMLVLMFGAMPLKYLAGMPTPTRIVGALHGLLFIMYVVALVFSGKRVGLTNKQIAIGVVLSCLPFGPFAFEAKILRAS